MKLTLILLLANAISQHSVTSLEIYPALSSSHVRFVETGVQEDCTLDPTIAITFPASGTVRAGVIHCTSDRVFADGFDPRSSEAQ